MAAAHTTRCTDNAVTVVDENNLDTLVERGINDRIAVATAEATEDHPAWLIANQIIDAELEAGYEAGTLSRSTEIATQWLDEGIITCRCND